MRKFRELTSKVQTHTHTRREIKIEKNTDNKNHFSWKLYSKKKWNKLEVKLEHTFKSINT